MRILIYIAVQDFREGDARGRLSDRLREKGAKGNHRDRGGTRRIIESKGRTEERRRSTRPLEGEKREEGLLQQSIASIMS